MIGAFRRLFGVEGRSKQAAKSRLSFVLVQDRTGLSQDDLSAFKKEMVDVIEKYFYIDERGLDVSYKRESDLTMLVINSPVLVKRQEGSKHKVGAKIKAATPVQVAAIQAVTENKDVSAEPVAASVEAALTVEAAPAVVADAPVEETKIAASS